VIYAVHNIAEGLLALIPPDYAFLKKIKFEISD